MGKKKKHEHHGGAWKVAYADFVTAMMALFMVLWISAQDQEIKIATSQYFANPFNSPLEASLGVMDGTGNGMGANDNQSPPASSMLDMAFLHDLAREFYRHLNIQESDDSKPVEISVTSDGLRITVYDRAAQPLFEDDSATFTDWGGLVIQNLAWIMQRYEMAVRIDAHTLPGEGNAEAGITVWELSTARANAARRALTYYALDADKIDRVTGFAHTRPVDVTDPLDESNRRIEISLVTP